MHKTIVVTGGTKGIGRSVIERFASEEFKIITCSRNQSDLDKLKSEMTAQYGPESIEIFNADLSIKKDRLSFCEQLTKFKVDVLVNNTGVFIPGQVHSEEEGVLEKTIETNLYSAYDVTRAIIETMKTNKSGHVFNMCSTASITPYINGGAYCISKYALYGFTKTLREEMKEHNVRVTAILPGANYHLH